MSKELDEKWLDLMNDMKVRWVPGMQDDEGSMYVGCGNWAEIQDFAGFVFTGGSENPIPDWGHPATLGCLLALVREAWGDDDIYFGSSLSFKRKRWSWVMGGGDRIGQGDTEAEALLAALEAAS